jgi:cytochrome c553
MVMRANCVLTVLRSSTLMLSALELPYLCHMNSVGSIPPQSVREPPQHPLFASNCSGCHGALDGADDNSDTLFPRIPQLHKVGTEYTEAQIFWIAKHGIRRTGMFANGKWYPDKDLWAMAAYVKHIRDLPPAVHKALESKK